MRLAGNGNDVHGDPAPLAVERDHGRMGERRFLLVEGAGQRQPEIEPQLRPHHRGELVGDRPGRVEEEAPRIRREVQDVLNVVDEHARGRALFQSGQVQRGRPVPTLVARGSSVNSSA